VDDDFEEGETGPRQFSYDDLATATENFSDDRRLGRGGFGSVYSGLLSDSGTNLYVAVKRVSETFRQGWKEFAADHQPAPAPQPGAAHRLVPRRRR
jgi:hypothetical protein